MVCDGLTFLLHSSYICACPAQFLCSGSSVPGTYGICMGYPLPLPFLFQFVGLWISPSTSFFPEQVPFSVRVAPLVFRSFLFPKRLTTSLQPTLADSEAYPGLPSFICFLLWLNHHQIFHSSLPFVEKTLGSCFVTIVWWFLLLSVWLALASFAFYFPKTLPCL